MLYLHAQSSSSLSEHLTCFLSWTLSLALAVHSISDLSPLVLEQAQGACLQGNLNIT